MTVTMSGRSSSDCPEHGLSFPELLLNRHVLHAGIFHSLLPGAMTHEELLDLLTVLTQHRLGNVPAAMAILLPALHASPSMQFSLGTADGWKRLLPFATEVVECPELLPYLVRWLDDDATSPGEGLLTSVLPFALLLGLSRSRILTAQPTPLPGRDQQLIANLTRLLETRHSGDLLDGSEIVYLPSMADEALLQQSAELRSQGPAHSEEAAGSRGPGSAALRTVIICLVSTCRTLAAREKVRPRWNGHALEAEWRLEGLGVRHDDKDAVRCILRWQPASCMPGGVRISSAARCSLGGREVRVRLKYQAGQQGSAGLFVLLDSGAGEPFSGDDLYHVTLFAVPEEQLPLLMDGQAVRSTQCRYNVFYMLPQSHPDGVGIAQWAAGQQLVQGPQDLYVCVDLRLATSSERPAAAAYLGYA